LVSALVMCHSVEGVYHNDIKPDNCVLNERNELVLIDFGESSRFSIEDGDDLIVGSKTIGTPLFFAPELFGKEDAHGRPADIWRAGLTLYMIAAAQGPYDDAKGMLDLKD